MQSEIRQLFSDVNDAKFAVYKYCASCAAHRVLKIGWEKSINLFPSRRLVLLAMFLPVHTRIPILKEAFIKAHTEHDLLVIKLINEQFSIQQKATA